MRRSIWLIYLPTLFFAASVHATSWEHLGPVGGTIAALATGDAATGRYVTVAARLSERSLVYRSRDNGATWRVGTAPAECRAFIQDLHARNDGRVVVDCGRLFISHDDDTWTAYGPPGFSGPLAIDPANASHALFLAKHRVDNGAADPTLYVTENDGVTWTMVASGGIPSDVAFDPSRPGRVVGLMIPYPPAPGQYVSESLDGGRTWRYLSTITFDTNCNSIGTFAIDARGTLYRYSGCGFVRSGDGGVTWERLSVPGPFALPLEVDRTLAGHVVGRAASGLWESFDAGATWSRLDAPDDLNVLDANNDLWGSTRAGVQLYDRGQRTWLDRSAGINALFARAIVANADNTVLAETALGTMRLGRDQSPTPLRIDNEAIYRLHPNAVPNAPLVARTVSSKLFRTEDGGRTWTLTAAGPGVDYDLTYDELVPVGSQPGIVFAVHKVFQGPFTGCCWVGKDIARSTDGGQTWTLTGSGAGQFQKLYVGRADTRTLFALGENGLFRSRDAGDQWTRIGGPDFFGNALVANALVADPVDPLRWYAVGRGGHIRASADAGDNWTDISVPYAFAGATDLIIDSADTRRLFLVHEDGGVSLSEDRGQSWRRVVSPSRLLDVLPGTALLRKGAPDTLYAGSYQGALNLRLDTLSLPEPVRAVEYHRQQGGFDRYFITADRAEMALLDNRSWQSLAYVRTGREFNVWPSGTRPPPVASPVCRFYAPPDNGLDSHFFSASPSECDAVKDRFGGSWIYETADAFVAGLPDADGTCPAATTPVYRLYNNRAPANHRYTTSRAVRAEMVAKGWLSEGLGSGGVVMCAP